MKSRWLPLLLMAAALALVGAGVAMGQPAQVMTKAVRICMECVGLG